MVTFANELKSKERRDDTINGRLESECRLKNLAISKYRFKLIAQTSIPLPPYKGFAFHGGFGQALRTIAPSWYTRLFEPGQAKTARPKPFVILAPLDDIRLYEKGQPFHFDLTLFGNAKQHFTICHAAIEYLGAQLGLGANKGKFCVENVEEIIYKPDNFDLPNPESHRSAPKEPTNLRLVLSSPLRLKANNRLHRESPSFQLLFERLVARVNTLAVFYGDGEIIEKAHHQQLIRQAAHINTITHNLKWEDWDRYSGRQQTWMKFGGLSGDILYRGHFDAFIPYLHLGKWAHLGGKTSFGLGNYCLEIEQ